MHSEKLFIFKLGHVILLKSKSKVQNKLFFESEELFPFEYWPKLKKVPKIFGESIKVCLKSHERYASFSIRRFVVERISLNTPYPIEKVKVNQYCFSEWPNSLSKLLMGEVNSNQLAKGLETLQEEHEFILELFDFAMKVCSERKMVKTTQAETIGPLFLHQVPISNSRSEENQVDTERIWNRSGIKSKIQTNMCSVYLALDQLITLSSTSKRFDIFGIVR